MAFIDLYSELRGSVPKLPISFAKTLVNRAWRVVRESNLWSFNLLEFAWITPPLINSGTVNVTQGLAAITFDATAIAAITAAQPLQPYSLITQRQFRIGVGGIYNLIALDPAFASNGKATLDRIYADPGGAGQAYTIYQVYYVPPVSDFLVLKTVRNTTMFLSLGLDMTRAEVDARDPQRSWYQFPTQVVPFGTDQRGAGTATPSATLGYPLFELWGQPVVPFTYQCYGLRRGVPLVNPTDALPTAVGEDLVLAKAYEYAYEWAESNKDMSPRSQGPDYRFLMGATRDKFTKLLTLYRKQDKETVNNWFSSRGVLWGAGAFGYYNTIAGVAGPYAQM